MGQIWEFLRSVSVHFGAGRQNVLKLNFKNLNAKFDIHVLSPETRDVRVGAKLGLIGPKGDKTGIFFDQFQYCFVRRAKMY